METSGKTLTLGSEGRTRLIFEAKSGPAEKKKLVDLARDLGVVWEQGEDGRMILGHGDRGQLRVIAGEPGYISLQEGLREIEAYEAGREAMPGITEVFAAILAADQGLSEGKKRVVGAPALFAHLAGEGGSSGGKTWSEGDLERETEHFLHELVRNRSFCRPIGRPLDCARFWLNIAERLWDPGVRAHLADLHLDETIRRMLVMLSGAWMDLKPEAWVKVAGTRFHLYGISKRRAWPQILEWEAGRIGRSTLKYLTAYQTDYPFDGLLGGLMGFEEAPHAGCSIEAIQAAKESRCLLQEAALNGTCDPGGSFRVDIPDRTPLREWAASSMRVWILPRCGLWVALERDERPGVSFQWTVRPPHVRRWVLRDDAIPEIHLTMSALWRDLKIGGRQVILAEGQPAEVRVEGGIEKIRLHGRIRWGSEEELERILREAYPVEEHIRLLPPGKRTSRRAFRRAMAKGIVLQPGTTLVRRHRRGKPDEDAARIPVKAQGLARLILASKESSNMKNPISRR